MFRGIFSSEIPFKFLFNKHIRFPHAVGIVISNAAIIGKNVTIFSSVTIGGKKTGAKKEFPIIEDDVTIFTGACIIGGVRIGQGSIIGANTTVTKNIPANSVVYNKTELSINKIL